MKSLTEIANFYATDKGTTGPSSTHIAHNYTDIYEAYIAPFRNTPITLLEIGIGLRRKEDPRIAHGRNSEGGASIKMWGEYLPKGTIHAMDIVPAPQLNTENVTTHVVDQSDSESLKAFIHTMGDTQFDFIIDDGSHHPNHQQLTLGLLFPLLRSGGVYFIEDLRPDGLGDMGKNGIINDRVLNTRRVLKHFNQHGVFEKPNTLVGEEYLLKHISDIQFHVPIQHINRSAVLKRLLGGKDRVLEFVPDSELMCAIRKK